MKWTYLIGLLLVALMVGCAAPTEPAAPVTEPEAPAAEPVAPVEEPVAPVEEPVAPAVEDTTASDIMAPTGEMMEADTVDTSELTESELAQLESMKNACNRGSLNLCVALKTHYDIDMSPGDLDVVTPAESPASEALDDAQDLAEEDMV